MRPRPKPKSVWKSPRVLTVALALVAVVLVALFQGEEGPGPGRRPFLVKALLVQGPERAPVAGARVLAVSSEDLGRDWNPEAAWAEVSRNELERAAARSAGEDANRWSWATIAEGAGGRSESDGAVEFIACLVETGHASNDPSRDEVQAPADAVAALWISREGAEPVEIRVEGGAWEAYDAVDYDACWGVYDLGTVVIPEEPAASR